MYTSRAIVQKRKTIEEWPDKNVLQNLNMSQDPRETRQKKEKRPFSEKWKLGWEWLHMIPLTQF